MVNAFDSLISEIRFSRKYDERWTVGIFSIPLKILRGGLPVYRVEDFHDGEIKETFYLLGSFIVTQWEATVLDSWFFSYYLPKQMKLVEKHPHDTKG